VPAGLPAALSRASSPPGEVRPGRQPRRSATPLYVAAGLAVLHSLVTAQAAPTNFSQRWVAKDEAALARVFDRFERWQTLRAVVQVLNFGAMLWALVTYVSVY
jgi:hypothetical protein